jgi:hypothetical protein
MDPPLLLPDPPKLPDPAGGVSGFGSLVRNELPPVAERVELREVVEVDWGSADNTGVLGADFDVGLVGVVVGVVVGSKI